VSCPCTPDGESCFKDEPSPNSAEVKSKVYKKRRKGKDFTPRVTKKKKKKKPPHPLFPNSVLRSTAETEREL